MAKDGAGTWMRELMDARTLREAALRAGALPPAVCIDGRDDTGPGWFESSWDLKQGLSVIEATDAQAELDAWMDEMMAQSAGGDWLLESV
ncbi:hypothetical protein [Piscinibacter terrae]|uniref:Uncharacterized protein n=1 Tax=Piscinibacter terrae TaxID=2496871 RepID=A0A3N7HSR1_9BURK|nr:hypothetical protein [Albitalea terrae]RQP23871.1 hypothetical protein DZC73_17310 [Albitalea terrae]